MAARADELVFLPLGGVGEIGMNLGLYGYGPPHQRTWIAIDFGIAFPHADLPGVDVIYPDIAYLEEERTNLEAIVITHAHEDHFGALIDLWPRLHVPVYATAFTAGLLNAKLASEPGTELVPVNVARPGERISLGPFEVEYVEVAHSIPESHSLVIRTALGTVVHSGDWKLDDHPLIGPPTAPERFRQIGREGVQAFVCDSTNALREGQSPSESEVAREIAEIVKLAKGRVVFTIFASNAGRIRSIAKAAAAAGREVVVVGRAMRRIIEVASELNMLDGLPPFLEEDAYAHLPRNKVVGLFTGSQGEPRAALARAALDEHPRIELTSGDTVVFSARAIPGNELDINRIINALATRGIRVVTDADRLVHTSGHPRRGELREMYGWLKPRVAVPVHGEAMHLAAHADLARELGIETVLTIANGTMVRLAPDPAEAIDAVGAGRLYKDGRVIGDVDSVGIAQRRKLAFAGHVAVSIVVDRAGDLRADPEVALTGLPQQDQAGHAIGDTVVDAVLDVIDSLPRPRRRDPDHLGEAVRGAVRSAVAEAWGKKPICTVLVSVV